MGIGAKFQYGLTDAIRVEPSFNYYLEKDGLSLWDANVNFHYLFDVADKVKVYPLAGIGLSHWDAASSVNELAVNLGAGAEYQLNDQWAVGAELKYQIIDNFNQMVACIGLTYRF